ncbi:MULTISPECIES: glycosyltransferase [unclassified Rathayibacter]|uniref:glycosyltransferase n=1 Tax=unclassified Rathayibacter TaxID=2609250 RepID=UPI000CE799EF|nr:MULTISPECIES: glycosyltransferase [unclassified Rathayibacter]PPG54027.1 glycosyl transferase [Rathayibacter sp. AY2B3]PPI20436.1 glycosyl transferase [Rathayibacter sp. AY1B6]PPI27467.1 glycosyl transferase [Rathayibacter sp. AY1B5]PPI39724.1 glycosyl transferase [Rathayibacter sp. AY1B1]
MSGVIVHEWIEPFGGAEKVLDAMADSFSDAEILCLWNDAPDRYPDHVVRETWLARTPLRSHKALSLPAMLPTWRSQPFHDYDWALVSSHAFAHHVRFRNQPDGFRKYVYAYTPARYVWNPELDSRGDGAAVRAVAPAFRGIDRRRAQEATSIAAISEYVKERIDRAWDRDSIVIHPPVDVERIHAVADWSTHLTPEEERIVERLPSDFVLGASRFIAYKSLELVIRVAEAIGTTAVLAGSGPEKERLEAAAAASSAPVVFIPRPSDALLFTLYERSLAYVFPPVEDFGIMPVEAMAVGTPVICSDTGGATETVVDGVTGVHIHDWDSADLADEAIRALSLDPEAGRRHSWMFARSRFEEQLADWVRS